MVQRVVISPCVGLFSVCHERLLWLREHGCKEALAEDLEEMDDDGIDRRHYWLSHIRRDDPLLIACIEAIPTPVNQYAQKLAIIDVPEGVEWHIHQDDNGSEHVAENHRIWFVPPEWWDTI